VPVPRSLITDLAAACAGRSPDELVFTAPKGGVLWLRNWRRRVFDPAVEGAGLGQLSPHELRHTAASLAVAAGANVKAVQRTLGHASAAMTLDVYSGLFDDDLDAVADRLDVAAQSAGESSRGLSADYLRTDGQLIKLQDRTETFTAQ
jgi:integrase